VERPADEPSSATGPTGIPRFSDLLPSAQRALGRFAVAGLLPILTFYVLFKVAGATAGIAGGMTVSLIALVIQLRRLGRLDPVVLVPMAVIAIQGTAALVLDSVELYLAAPSVENALWGIVLVGSVAARRPLARVIARELNLVPLGYERSATVGRALGLVTLAWGIAAFAKAGVRLWLLVLLPLEAFLLAITVFHLVLNGTMVAFSFWWPLRAVKAESRAPSPSAPSPAGRGLG
jgi:intracellular septation protein A